MISTKSTDIKKVRHHGGIIQYGSNRGKLKKGYMYTGGKTKTNLSVIVKTNNNICSPEKKDNDKYSCLSVKALQRIAREYNNKYAKKDQIIKIHDTKRNITKSLLNHLCKDFDDIDYCILSDKRLSKNSEIIDDIKESFKPPKPQGKHEWLNSINIYDVMEQYMEKYPDFIFMGPVPIDFQKILTEVANINLKSLSSKKKKIGIIFNTDPHYMGGSHWISLFLDLTDKTICFYDSVGDEPPKECMDLINKLLKQANDYKLIKYLNIHINDKQHQYRDSECGVYSLYFIIQRLRGISCQNVFTNIIRDNEMNKNRDVIFNKRFPNLLKSFDS